MTLTSLDDLGIWVAAVVGGFVALGWIIKKARRVFSILEKLDHEINENSGKSIKDVSNWTRAALDEMNAALAVIAPSLDDFGHRLTSVEKNLRDESRDAKAEHRQIREDVSLIHGAVVRAHERMDRVEARDVPDDN